ncbi:MULTISPECIES: metal-sulfur cluster assembly factor [Corynebacterium]|uniref:metal-sulfur cluster assembly factor n=1 Tax=Corynebacterium TaxID=1716 RepID=UPI00124D1B86|nr:MULTISPECIES: metal-sulfur cluster assembly factor [Corynebacterium]
MSEEHTTPETEDTTIDAAAEQPQPPAERTPEQLALAGKVEEYLMDVIDPELGINVVDLGLVYDIWIEGESTAMVNMTLTSPACPLQGVIEEQANTAVLSNLEGEISELQINWVWMPAWGPQMINEEGREQLRALGFSV